MAVHELTTVELDTVCGGSKYYSKSKLEIEVNVVKVDQNQSNYTKVVFSKNTDASNNQLVTIGSVG